MFTYVFVKTRATLTVDPELHARAKRLARQRKTTVSGLFESFLVSQPDPRGSRVDGLIGSASLKAAPNQPDPRREYLNAKYLK